jgi:hypothetical protein
VSFCFFLECNGAQQTSKEFALMDFILKATTPESQRPKGMVINSAFCFGITTWN